MRRRLGTIAAIVTPVIAIASWIVAYRVAVSNMGSPPCCENGMDTAPIVTLFFALPGLTLGSLLGGIGLSVTEKKSTRIGVAVAAWVVTLLTALWMFVEPPRELSADKTAFGDYWPLTPGSVAALVVGFVLTMLPWTLVLVASTLERHRPVVP